MRALRRDYRISPVDCAGILLTSLLAKVTLREDEQFESVRFDFTPSVMTILQAIRTSRRWKPGAVTSGGAGYRYFQRAGVLA